MTKEREGKKVVLGFLGFALAIVTTLGYLIGLANPEGLEKPKFLFLIELPKTPFGMALFGALSVSLFIVVVVALVKAASKFEKHR